MNDPSRLTWGVAPGVIYALLAAALFGASTPFAKMLVVQVAPVTLAGVLYLGSGVGLLLCFTVRALVTRDEHSRPVALTRLDIYASSVRLSLGESLGQCCAGLTTTPASSASLLLEMEGVLTALLARFVFEENFDRRIFLGWC